MTRPTAADAIDAVWRIESARLIAGLARLVGDIGVAEDLAQDALVAALEQWPQSGVPDNPGAWLMATAKHRAIDHLRRGKMQDRKHEHLGRELEERLISPEPDLAAPSWRSGSSPCSRSSISFSTRDTRRRQATRGCGRRCARTRSASAAFSPSWRRRRRRSTDWSR